ncbi:phage antirepressor protein [Amycolatopsis sp. WAC 04182]|uniref:phage antirepressor n=1 Tax=Amycolatopsis sp. WAC 04182 TaxID=2203198 RepID=UPI000F76D4BD|nr:phage antirepressor [Amycolatopsis sp. WAC 04182]RSN65455.1 phage antirepressor protein [Amycolatopsis sp. WAC 04182]
MSELIPFDFKGTAVRVVIVDGEPWFVAGDACVVLGYSNSRDAVAKHVRDHQKRVSRIATPSGEQAATVISEGGLYRLLMRARTVLADQFQDWVTDEVLPSIRKTGKFDLTVPETFADALELAAKQARELEAKDARIGALEPVAKSWEQLADAAGDYSLREAAQILNRDPSISTGQNRLAKTLKGLGWTDRTGQPYQAQIDNGRLAVRSRDFFNSGVGEQQVTTQVRITAKGVHELHRRMGGSGPLLLAA